MPTMSIMSTGTPTLCRSSVTATRAVPRAALVATLAAALLLPAPPLANLLAWAGHPALSWWVALGATAALGGVLLNLVLGLSRVWLAMGRRGDMPAALANLNAAGTSPRTAVLFSGVLIGLLSLGGRLELTWGFSAFTVLGYYAITNLCVLRLQPTQRWLPTGLPWLGLFSCLGLAAMVPVGAWASGLALLLIALGWRWLLKG